MLTNKELKEKGRKTVKSHYLLLLVLCAIMVLFGNEFNSNAGILQLDTLLGEFQKAQEQQGDSSGSVEGLNKASDKVSALRDRIGVLGPGVHDAQSVEVIRDILHNDVMDGVELANSLEEQFEESGTDVVGHTEGVLAYAINTVTSGTLALYIFYALDTITGSPEAAKILFAILGLIVCLFLFAFIPEIYSVAMRRFFLEARVYEKVPLQHGFHLLKVRRCVRATLTIAIKDMIYFAWSLTIVGAFIKRYSYYLVPFIVAENPDLRPREAITLSRKMMYGHKMEAFKFEMSFLHWLIIGVITLGLSNVFYYLPYKIAATTEYYACIRAIAKEAEVEGAELLDDDALLAKAGEELLHEVYADTKQRKAEIDASAIELAGKQKFFAEKLAIWIGSSENKVRYQEQENNRYRLSEDLQALDGKVYPVQLDPRNGPDNRKVSHQINFLRCYTIWSLFSMFLLFAFIGWVWEVLVFLVETGEFVNRGTLYGPWVPIYGAGGTLIIVILASLRKRRLTMFFAIIVLCGVMEYGTSWVLEKLYDQRWWDYSGYFLNLDGRICAEGLIAFGVLGMMGIYILAPALDTLFMKINARLLSSVTIALMIVFFCDVVYSQIHPHTGKGITDMGANTVTAVIPQPDGPQLSPKLRI